MTTKFKKFGVAAFVAGATMLSANMANANDPVDWRGFYLGGSAGFGKTYTSGTWDSEGSEIDLGQFGGTGWFGGAQVGYNWQRGPWVFGIEGDVSFADFDQTINDVDEAPDVHVFNTKYMVTARARAGLAVERGLLFVTAGIGHLAGDVTFEINDPDKDSFDFGATGAVFGGGVEYRVTERVSVKLEGLHMIADEGRNLNGFAGDGDDDDNFHFDGATLVRFGVNFALGGK